MAAQSFLTSTSATVQTTTLSADWDDDGATIEGIGPGGNGSARQSSSIGGTGGGAGSYAKITRAGLSASQVCYYLLPAGGSAVDAWFNDLNQLLQSDAFASVWSTLQCTATTGQTDPLGGTKAVKIVPNTTVNVYHTYAQSIAVKHSGVTSVTVRASFKGSGYTQAALEVNDNVANGAYRIVDLNNSANDSSQANGTGWSVSSVTRSVNPNDSNFTDVILVVTCPTAQSAIGIALTPLNGLVSVFTGDGTSGIIAYGANYTYGSLTKVFTPTTSTALYSILAKCGTNGTTSAAGVGQSGSQGDSTAQGGGGFKPGAGVAIGGGGGGSGGPNGAGTTSSTSAGGAADNSTVTGGAQGAAGNSGTEFDGSHGCGSGGGGRSGNGGGFAGGNYGGGGSGTGTQAGQTGGAGAPSLIILTPSFKPYLNMPTMRPAGRAM